MNLCLVTPAPIIDILDLYAAAVPMKPINARAAILQAARSESFALYAGDELAPVATALLYPLDPEKPGERLVELAFVCRPELSRHVLSLIRHAHLTRARLVQSGPVRVRAHVHSNHLPGHRLAALCGMTLVGRFGAFDRYELAMTRSEGQPDEYVRQRDQIALHGA